MAEIFVFCSSRTRSVLVCAGLGSTAPHEVAGLAVQWEWNCDVMAVINSVGLPVVAMLATPGCGRSYSQAARSVGSPPQEVGAASCGAGAASCGATNKAHLQHLCPALGRVLAPRGGGGSAVGVHNGGRDVRARLHVGGGERPVDGAIAGKAVYEVVRVRVLAPD